MRLPFLPASLAAVTLAAVAGMSAAQAETVSVGPRPAYLIDKMKDGELKEKLKACLGQPVRKTLFSIAHRGAPLEFPEHSEEGYKAAASMGAGIIECDVTFTRDKQLVCRHAQDDLATSTNILATNLAGKCITPFAPAANGEKAKAECRTSELTLAEFQSLSAKMDGADRSATTLEAYMNGSPRWRTDLYSPGTLMTHKGSIELIRSLGGKFTPELKAPEVTMPFDGMSQQDYAQMLIDEYKQAGIPAADVWPQSFNLEDVLYWIRNEPEFGKQAVYLDGRNSKGLDPLKPETFQPSMKELKDMGVTYIAPPIWMLLTVVEGQIVPSPYAVKAKAAGLKTIAWSLERSGPITRKGGGWYYQTINSALSGEGDLYEIVDVLAQDVGVSGIFSDWPATVSYYASCMGLD